VDLRLKEAEKLGFTRAWIAPRRSQKKGSRKAGGSPVASGLTVEEIPHLQDLVARLAAPADLPQGRSSNRRQAY